ncbi:MAG: hypothetical protein IKT52_12450 [Oscillospiraceae bacterium]|nr:hypothetical protein [Oscillospiraceae bacterium]
MKKKTWLIVAAICILLVLVGAITFANRSTPEDEIMDMLNRVENALGNEWEKQTVTKVSDLVYSDNKGNTIVYHVCITTYFGADTSEQTGLNIDAISAIIPPDEAESYRECTVSKLPAAIYQKDGRAYLCWTIIPELSCVIEYDPAVESEEDMFRMAESVPANTATTDNP